MRPRKKTWIKHQQEDASDRQMRRSESDTSLPCKLLTQVVHEGIVHGTLETKYLKGWLKLWYLWAPRAQDGRLETKHGLERRFQPTAVPLLSRSLNPSHV